MIAIVVIVQSRDTYMHAQDVHTCSTTCEGPSSSSGARSVELLPLTSAIVVKLLKTEKAGSMFIVNFVPKF